MDANVWRCVLTTLSNGREEKEKRKKDAVFVIVVVRCSACVGVCEEVLAACGPVAWYLVLFFFLSRYFL